MKTRLWNLIKLLHLGSLVLFIHPKSALRQLGWFKSFHQKKVIDKKGNPIPWWTYSFIDFIKDRLTKNFRVLEFGCGGSTIWLSFRVKEVLSFEDFQTWADKTRNKISDSSKIIDVKSISDFNSYKDKIAGLFDILIIDNLGDRMECVKRNLSYLKDDGVIIWDNTNGPDWRTIKSYMSNQGYKEISFTGMVAQELSYSKTTLFYKDKNCFNI